IRAMLRALTWPVRAIAGLVVALVSLLLARGRSEDGVTSDEVALEEREQRNPVGGVSGAAEEKDGRPQRHHDLPDADTCREVIEKMLLIRRFEERAGEMYAKAKIGGFLHLSIGEEATIVGAIDALRDTDYVLSTYREHGQALARGTSANAVMAELFGRVDGCSKGRGGSMHLFDMERRFLGGYGIVGGNLPLAAGVALACDYEETEDAVLCMFGDGASNQGTFGETMNLAALWKLPVVFLVVNNQFGMGTALERHSAVTDLSRKSGGFGVPGTRCDGMDVLDVHEAIGEALRKAREDRAPQLVEAVTYRFRGHSMADPEEYRSKEEVEEWRGRDPIETFRARLADEGVMSEEDFEKLDERVTKVVDESVEFADQSPFPDLDTLYEDIYVYGEQVRGWYSVDERSPEVHPGEKEAEAGDVAHELAEAGAAYARVGDAEERARRTKRGADEEDSDEGEGEPSDEERDEEGGGD
ncbi:MAG: pyruvate dehydrogenase (acetyl-transferring) E1 component subunit alpha, partial [Actinomycetota bacterium]|nr:pyruvate dehydrogenase (acetyl-transferring) E1 component subunit alpha [Actinomycetota bacterium]